MFALHTSVCLHKSTNGWKGSQASNRQTGVWVGLDVTLGLDWCMAENRKPRQPAGRVRFSNCNVWEEGGDRGEAVEGLKGGFV
jgi:hypothetical protein